jgi:L-fuconolactonase
MGKPAVRDWGTKPQAPRRWLASMRELATMPHVMCKLSGAVTETAWQNQARVSPQDVRLIHSCFDHALELFGPQRLMFGSDWPVCQLASSFEAVTSLAQTWAKSRLTQREQEAFWSGNAIRAYGLSVRELAQ